MTLPSKTFIFGEHTEEPVAAARVKQLPDGALAVGFVHTSTFDNGGNGFVFPNATHVETVEVTIGDETTLFPSIPKDFKHTLPGVTVHSTFTMTVHSYMPTQQAFVIAIYNEMGDTLASIRVVMCPTNKKRRNTVHQLHNVFPGTAEAPWFTHCSHNPVSC